MAVSLPRVVPLPANAPRFRRLQQNPSIQSGLEAELEAEIDEGLRLIAVHGHHQKRQSHISDCL